MRRADSGPWPWVVGLWIPAEMMRAIMVPSAALHLRLLLAAIDAPARSWPIYHAWGLGCVPEPDGASRQQQSDGCGAAVLQAVLRSHGRPVPQRLLWSLTRLRGGGTTAARLADVGNHFGLECRVRRVTRAPDSTLTVAASSWPLPAVLHLRRGHFVVVRRWTASAVQVFDPAYGGVRVRPQALWRRASGIAVTCVDPENRVPHAARRADAPARLPSGGRR